MTLSLTPLAADDAEFILALLTDKDWLRHIGDKGVFDLPSAANFIRQREQTYLHGLPSFFVARQNGQAIGLCTFLQRDYLQVPDIGYGFLPTARGKGYAYRAIQLLMEKCQKQTDLNCLCAIAAADNQASIKLLQRLGFLSVGAVQSADYLSQVFSRRI